MENLFLVGLFSNKTKKQQANPKILIQIRNIDFSQKISQISMSISLIINIHNGSWNDTKIAFLLNILLPTLLFAAKQTELLMFVNKTTRT